MKYFYGRVSSKQQNLNRQLESATKYGADKVFTDKQSGKDMNRPEYQRMKRELVAGDEVIVHALDRLGRNKEAVKDEVQWFKDHGITLRILNIPTTLIDFQGQDWVQDMINNIIIEVLSSVAENERREIRERQAEGIAAMPVVGGKKVSSKTGRGFGRPKLGIPADFGKFREKQKRGEVTVEQACAEMGISRSSWYKLCGV